jgi:hypothetical protein
MTHERHDVNELVAKTKRAVDELDGLILELTATAVALEAETRRQRDRPQET